MRAAKRDKRTRPIRRAQAACGALAQSPVAHISERPLLPALHPRAFVAYKNPGVKMLWSIVLFASTGLGTGSSRAFVARWCSISHAGQEEVAAAGSAAGNTGSRGSRGAWSAAPCAVSVTIA